MLKRQRTLCCVPARLEPGPLWRQTGPCAKISIYKQGHIHVPRSSGTAVFEPFSMHVRLQQSDIHTQQGNMSPSLCLLHSYSWPDPSVCVVETKYDIEIQEPTMVTRSSARAHLIPETVGAVQAVQGPKPTTVTKFQMPDKKHGHIGHIRIYIYICVCVCTILFFFFSLSLYIYT